MARESKSKPYMENYPELHNWVRSHEARCDWQVPVGPASNPEAYIEQWRIDGGYFVVLIRADELGWDIFTPCNDRSVKGTLADLERRLAPMLSADRKSETRNRFEAAMAMIAQGVVNIESGLGEIKPTSRVHVGMTDICEMVTDGKVGLL